MLANISKLRLRAFAGSAAILAASMAIAASAQPASQIDVSGTSSTTDITRSKLVATRDINLAEPRGQRILDRRLRVAAGQVCDVWDVSPTRPASGYSRCYGEALENARAQASQRSARNDGAAIRVSAS